MRFSHNLRLGGIIFASMVFVATGIGVCVAFATDRYSPALSPLDLALSGASAGLWRLFSPLGIFLFCGIWYFLDKTPQSRKRTSAED
jgi:hypothetical protein